MDFIHIYRPFYQKAVEYTFISSAHGTFSRIDHILGHKSSRGKFKKIEIISSIFSDHNAMRLEINYRLKNVKNTLDQMDFIHIYRPFYQKAVEYTFISGAHGTFSRIDYMLGHRTILNKFKKIEITSNIFSAV